MPPRIAALPVALLLACAPQPGAHVASVAAATPAAVPPTLDLYATAVVPRRTLILAAFAAPGERVRFYVTAAGPGAGPCFSSGECLDLAQPNFLIGNEIADPSGVAWTTVSVPASIPAPAVTLQAAVWDGTSLQVSPSLQRTVGDRDLDGWAAAQDCDDRDPSLQHDDLDGDGTTTCDGDCDDFDPLVSPAVDEIYYDGLDNDCDTATNDRDQDDDGATVDDDCDDVDDTRSPDFPESVGDGIDNDCDVLTPDNPNGICEPDEQGSTDCDGGCATGEDGSVDCDGVCQFDDAFGPDCDGLCSPGEASSSDCDGVCAPGEQASSSDCDGVCAPGEQASSSDCDGVCAPGEQASSSDCDGVCAPGEQASSSDCDGVCAPGESGSVDCSGP